MFKMRVSAVFMYIYSLLIQCAPTILIPCSFWFEPSDLRSDGYCCFLVQILCVSLTVVTVLPSDLTVRSTI